MKVFALIAALGGAMLTVPTAVAAPSECSAQFSILGQQATVAYNPYTPQQVTDFFQVKVKRLTQGVNEIRFILVDTTPIANQPKAGPGGPDIYDIVWQPDPGRRVFVWGAQQVTSLNAARVNFGGGGANDTDVTTFQLQIPRGQSAAAGTQVENLAVRYQCFSGRTQIGNEIEQRFGNMDVTVNVPRYVAAYIGSAGQTRGQVDFGTLTGRSGTVRRNVSVTALSTVPYEVTFESENAGVLKRARADDDGIAYSMSYAGVPVNLARAVICPAVLIPSGRADRVDFTLNDGQAAALPAGAYSDVVTITFAPREGVASPSCQTGR